MLTANPFQESMFNQSQPNRSSGTTVQDAGLLSEAPWQRQIATPQLPVAKGNAELKRKK